MKIRNMLCPICREFFDMIDDGKPLSDNIIADRCPGMHKCYHDYERNTAGELVCKLCGLKLYDTDTFKFVSDKR